MSKAKKSYINISELIHNFEKDKRPQSNDPTFRNSRRKESEDGKKEKEDADRRGREDSRQEREANKENVSQNRSQHTRPSSQTSSYDTSKNANEPIDMLSKTMKIDKRTPLHLQQQRHPLPKKQSYPSVYETLRKPALEQIAHQEPRRGPSPSCQGQKLQMLESLIVSEKMFIDPDRWESFLAQSQTDDKFHRALSAFLYSYFIQNYQ